MYSRNVQIIKCVVSHNKSQLPDLLVRTLPEKIYLCLLAEREQGRGQRCLPKEGTPPQKQGYLLVTNMIALKLLMEGKEK